MSLLLCIIVTLGSTSTLQPLVSKLRDTAFMTGEFTQTDFWALTLEEETSAGTMFMAQPDLFLLSYTDPQGAMTGFDGTVMYTVEPDVQQVIVYPSREPDSFLHLLDSCSDTTVHEVTEISGDSVWIDMHGDFGGGINRMEVAYTTTDSLPFLFSTTDYNGNTTTYRLWDICTSSTVPESTFLLEVPQGYSIINPEEM